MYFVRLSMMCAAIISSASYAQTPSNSSTKVTDRNDPNFVICRRQQVTGNYAASKKTCRTRAEWIAETRGAQEAAQNWQDKGMVNSCSSPDRSGC